MSNLKNSTILLTGGTGSFGSAFIPLTLKKYKPKKLIVFSRDESKQWHESQKINDSRLEFVIGDIRDKQSILDATKNVDYVVHAAAMKIVTTAETNPYECVKTNVIGAMNVIDACINKNVVKVLALSTDKACNPINLYGSTKLASDKLFISANHYSAKFNTKFSVMRYGNVIGSRGSVVPFFLEMKKNKKSIPVTNIEMTRFMISLEDAVKASLVSVKEMIGGEIFVQKCPSIKIIDLAKAISNDVKIIGKKPCEKINEMMIDSNESENTFEFNDYFKIVPRIFSPEITKKMIINGKKVKKDFEYVSNINKNWITKDKIKKLIKKIV